MDEGSLAVLRALQIMVSAVADALLPIPEDRFDVFFHISNIHPYGACSSFFGITSIKMAEIGEAKKRQRIA